MNTSTDPQLNSRPTILYVEDDNDTRHVIKQSLKRYGYRVFLAVSEEHALDNAVGGRIRADLLLIDLGEPPHIVLAAGRRIRQQAMVRADAPIVVIAFGYGADMEGKDINEGGNDYISYFDGSGHFQRLLARLLNQAA
jgi:CheY-like chemotaxis protein